MRISHGQWARHLGLAALLALPAMAYAQSDDAAAPADPWGEEAWDEEADWGEDPWATESSGWQLYGFLEGATAARIHNDPAVNEDYTLNELRGQLEAERVLGEQTLRVKGDLWADGVEDGLRGDLREANLSGRLSERIDYEIGRQILTWGTGDLVFLNDLFPKDYVSFFSGRDDEYLKAPVDALKLSFFGDVNLDLVWLPRANPNRFITGERLSYFSAEAGRRVAAPPEIDPDDRDDWLDDSEWAMRLYQTIRGTEYAAYAFHGFDKQPSGLDPVSNRPLFPRLSSLGASIRRPIGAGVGNLEAAYYHGQDSAGTDPNRPNDQWRLLAGFEHEAATDLTLGWQYYLEWTQDHDALIANTPSAQRPFAVDEYRHLLTNRITYQMLRQDLTLTLMTFYSPSDQDYYLRPRAQYRFNDRLIGTLGGNLFGGEDDWTFHTQLEDNSNLYARIRYNF